MTRLRKMMLEELQRRNYSAITTRNYLRVVSDFAKHFGKSPDKLGPNELRTYQAYLLTECKLTPGSVVNRVAALRFFFVKTLKRHQFREFLPYPPGPAPAADGAQPGGSCAIDRCRPNPVSTDIADDAVRVRRCRSIYPKTLGRWPFDALTLARDSLPKSTQIQTPSAREQLHTPRRSLPCCAR